MSHLAVQDACVCLGPGFYLGHTLACLLCTQHTARISGDSPTRGTRTRTLNSYLRQPKA